MVYNRFYLTLGIHAILFMLLAYLSVWAVQQEHLKFTGIGFGLLAFLTTFLLGFRVLRYNRKILSYLEDHSIDEPYPRFKGPFKDPLFLRIESELNRLASTYSALRLDKEAGLQLTRHIVEHMDTALFTVDIVGNIGLSNHAANSFFDELPARTLDSLERKHPELGLLIRPGMESKTQLVPIVSDSETRHILVKVSSHKLKDSCIHVCILDDITGEMFKTEDRNWQQLLRILRHEIINSITPIVSLADSLIDTYREKMRPELPDSPGDSDSIFRGLKAIDIRSKGLIDFVKSYKTLLESPEPVIDLVSVERIFVHLHDLFREELSRDHIRFEVDCEDNLEIRADEGMITQVFVNLIRNAHESLLQVSRERIIMISAERQENSVKIKITDTGQGIEQEYLDQIFVPFFTTKEKGTGIGLSLSRQIINQHGGTIRVRSSSEETVFLLNFPNLP